MIDFSIIIPCKDEQDNVDIILSNIKKNCKYENYEILFIEDFSKDQTLNILKKLSLSNQNVFFYENKKKGLGGAISLGLKKAKGNFITIMMADGADSIDDLNYYFKLIKENDYDAIFGSRFIKGSVVIDYPKIKLILNRIFNYLTKFLFFSNYNDFTNSFKIYKKQVIMYIDPLVSENFNIFLELPLKTISRGFRYKIIPIKYFNRTKGTAKFKINELGSSYLFTLLYCLLEKILLNKKFK
tara:strand:+ start:980 stop:1702 length:723 start_codon:yes stop_codon:yes gene_type:complete